MGKALYRVYRPKNLAEVVGQEHITKTLEQALNQGRISHAYLFTGPRGVGKTSVARIWAHEINGLPYQDDQPHIDIIEIDAASNRRIDEIRDLRDRVAIAPASAKYKVYIIDEVHMLTREAFNALLKTLEEPPAHVVFILATTDAHKLPETIISRTQRFSFRPAEKNQVKALLQQIVKQEKLTVDEAALDLLAEHGGGSFRDSVSLLDQASNQGNVTAASVLQTLGIPPDESLEQLLDKLDRGTPSAALMSELAQLYDQGFQAAAIAKRLGQLLRGRMLHGDGQPADLALLRQLIDVPAAYDPERYLELTLLEHSPSPSVEPAAQPSPEVLPRKTASTPAPTTPDNPASDTKAMLDQSSWPKVLALLKQRHNTLYGVVRMAEPDFQEPGKLCLRFAFAFHQKRLNENANRDKLAAIIQESTGLALVVEGVYDSEAKPPTPELPKADSPHLTAISNIFGNAELLES